MHGTSMVRLFIVTVGAAMAIRVIEDASEIIRHPAVSNQPMLGPAHIRAASELVKEATKIKIGHFRIANIMP